MSMELWEVENCSGDYRVYKKDGKHNCASLIIASQGEVGSNMIARRHNAAMEKFNAQRIGSVINPLWTKFDPDDVENAPWWCTKSGGLWMIIRNGGVYMELFNYHAWTDRGNEVIYYCDPQNFNRSIEI